MSPPPEEMMSWLLEQLGIAGAEGTSLQTLFDGVNEQLSATSQPALSDDAKDDLWKALLAREDFIFLDETKRNVAKILEYNALAPLGFGKEMVGLHNANFPSAPNGVAQRQQSAMASSPAQSILKIGIQADVGPDDVMPAPKRRGRPPKKTKSNASTSTARKSVAPLVPSAEEDTVAASPAGAEIPAPVSAPKRRGRPSKNAEASILESAPLDVENPETASAEVDASSRPKRRGRASKNPGVLTSESALPDVDKLVMPSVEADTAKALSTRTKSSEESSILGMAAPKRKGRPPKDLQARASETAQLDIANSVMPPREADARPDAKAPATTSLPGTVAPRRSIRPPKPRRAPTPDLQELNLEEAMDTTIDTNTRPAGPAHLETPAADTSAVVNTPKRRGRPPKNPKAANPMPVVPESGELVSQPEPTEQDGTLEKLHPTQHPHRPPPLPHMSKEAAPQQTASKRKAENIVDTNSHNEGGQPPKKRAYRRKATTLSSAGADAAASIIETNSEDSQEHAKQASKVADRNTPTPADLSRGHSSQPLEVRFQTPLGLQSHQKVFSQHPQPLVTQSMTPSGLESQQHISSRFGNPPYKTPYPALVQSLSQREVSRSQSMGMQDPIPPASHDLPKIITPVATPLVLTSLEKSAGCKKRVSDAYIQAAEVFWHRKTFKELKEECTKYGLIRSGGKQDLITRLKDDFFELDGVNDTDVLPPQKQPESITPRFTPQPSLEQALPSVEGPVDSSPSSRRSVHRRSTPTSRLFMAAQAHPGSDSSSHEVEAPGRKISKSQRLPKAKIRENQTQSTQRRSLEGAPMGKEITKDTVPPAPRDSNEDASIIPSVEQADGLPRAHTNAAKKTGFTTSEQIFVDQYRHSSATGSVDQSVHVPLNARSMNHLPSQNGNFARLPPQPSQPYASPYRNSGPAVTQVQGTSPAQLGFGLQVDRHYSQPAQLQNADPWQHSAYGARSNIGGYPPRSYLSYEAAAQDQMSSGSPFRDGPVYPVPSPYALDNNHQVLPSSPSQGFLPGQVGTRAVPSSHPHAQLPTEYLQPPGPVLEMPGLQDGGHAVQESTLSKRGTSSELLPQQSFPPVKVVPSSVPLPETEKAIAPSLAPSVQHGRSNSARAKRLEAMEEKLEQLSDDAKAMDLPNMGARFFVSYQDRVGNLALSQDQSQLMFYALDPELDESLMLSLQITQLKEDPKISRKRSRPMELRLDYNVDEESGGVCRFFFGQTDSQYQAATEMRIAIVKARIIALTATDQAAADMLLADEAHLDALARKPFTCQTCDKRFKNQEGINYHLSRSQTACNPNFIPSTSKVEKKARKPKALKMKESTAKRSPRKRVAKPEALSEDVTSDKESNVDEDSASQEDPDTPDSDASSVDSIFAWAENVAFVNPGSAVKVAPPRPRGISPRKIMLKVQVPKSLIEEKLLSDILAESLGSAKGDESIDDAVDAVLRDVIQETIIYTTMEARVCGSMSTPEAQEQGAEDKSLAERVLFRRIKDAILEIVTGNFGMFPGDQALWMALVGIWLENNPQSGVLPSSTLCEEALDQLVQDGRLTLVKIPGREGDDTAPSQSLVFLPRSQEQASVGLLTEMVQFAYPRSYVPSRFAPQPAPLERLQNFSHGPLVTKPAKSGKKRQRYRKRIAVSSKDDSEFDSASRDAVHDVALSEEDTEDEDYDTGLGQKKFDASEKLRTRKPGSRSRRSGAATAASNTGLSTLRQQLRQESFEATSIMTSSPNILQNAESGAWADAPVHVLPPHAASHPFAPRVKRGLGPRPQYSRKYRLPEPITYLQSTDGAWNNRAYGHGVAPIFSRPSRRTDGNPNTDRYLQSLAEGFRPVLMPTERSVRMYLPHPPSKFLLQTGKLPEPKIPKPVKDEDETEAEPKVKRAKRTSFSAALEDTTVELPVKRIRTGPRALPHLRQLRPPPEESPIIDLDFPIVSEFEPSRKPVTRAAPEKYIQDQYLLKHRTFDEMQELPNPGLVSLPSKFWAVNPMARGPSPQIDETLLSPDVFSHLPPSGVKGFDTVAEWEQGLSRDTFQRGNGSKIVGWIGHTMETFEDLFNTRIPNIQWSEDRAFGIENLPYQDLVDTEEPEYVVTGRVKKVVPSQSKRTQQSKQSVVTDNSTVLRRRRLTAFPSDFDGVVDSYEKVAKEFDVQLAPQSLMHYRNDGGLSAEEEHRFIVSVTVISTLTGGIEKYGDWVLVSALFPYLACHYVKKAWSKIYKSQKTLMDSVSQDFQEEFLVAYEKGELPKINFDNLVEYDWPNLVAWANKKVFSKKRIAKHFPLPPTRKELKRLYDSTEKESPIDKNRDYYFSPIAATYKRMELVAITAQVIPILAPPANKSASDIVIDEFTIARSWVRALCLTPQEDFDPEEARMKLRALGEELAAEARESLVEEKIIRNVNNGRAAPGRPFEPTDFFLSALRHHVTEQQFIEAVAFKKSLDDAFEGGEECVRCSYVSDEGTTMCITSMQANGRISLKAVDTPMEPFGLTDGGYETNKIPKERFTIKVDIYPTSTYLFDSEIPELTELADPPRGGDAGEIPLWYGISDTVIPEMWKKVLVGVGGVIALQSGASVASLQNTFKPALETWELWRLVEWGEQVGMLKRCHEGFEGWNAGEWWWAIVGRSCPRPDL